MAKWQKKLHLVDKEVRLGSHRLPVGQHILEGDYWAQFRDVLDPVSDNDLPAAAPMPAAPKPTAAPLLPPPVPLDAPVVPTETPSETRSAATTEPTDAAAPEGGEKHGNRRRGRGK